MYNNDSRYFRSTNFPVTINMYFPPPFFGTEMNYTHIVCAETIGSNDFYLSNKETWSWREPGYKGQ